MNISLFSPSAAEARGNFIARARNKITTESIFVCDGRYTYMCGRREERAFTRETFYSQYGGGRRYAVGYPVDLQEHTAHGGLEAQALGRTRGVRDRRKRRQREREQQQDQRRRGGGGGDDGAAARTDDVMHRPSHRAH